MNRIKLKRVGGTNQNKPNTQNIFIKMFFHLKRFDINKFEKLDIENKP